MSDWISVKERLPEKGVPVLAWNDSWGDIYMMVIDRSGRWADMPYYDLDDPSKPTHWMPLPPAPQTKEEK